MKQVTTRWEAVATAGLCIRHSRSGFYARMTVIGKRSWRSLKTDTLSHFFHGFQQQDHRHLIGRIDTQFHKLAAEYSAAQVSLPFPVSPGSAWDLALKVIPHDDPFCELLKEAEAWWRDSRAVSR